MVFISVLTPAVEHVALSADEYGSYCQTLFSTQKFQLWKLVPLEPGETAEEVVVRLEAGMSLKAIEALLQEKEELALQIDQAKEALKYFSLENLRMKDQLNQNKGQRIKSLEDENRKLRSVLQNSLETEKLTRSEKKQTTEQLQATISQLETRLREKEGAKKEEMKPPEPARGVPKLQLPKGNFALPGKT